MKVRVTADSTCDLSAELKEKYDIAIAPLTVLLGGDTAALSTMFTPFTAVVFLVFTLLYTPCVAAVAAAKRELGSAKAAAGVVVMQCGIAWVVAFVVHCIGTLLGFV